MLRIIATEPGGKTARYFQREGLDFRYVACECQRDRFDGEPTDFYTCKGYHGSAVARRAALDIPDSVVFDDDYGSISALGMADSNYKARVLDGEDLMMVLDSVKELERLAGKKTILGGYSGGAINSEITKMNIMQIFFAGEITRFFRDTSDLYRLNDDVCACIMARMRGYDTIGLWGLLRSGSQTAELEDNTNGYGDRSWAKSFLAYLYAPVATTIVFVPSRKRKNGSKTAARYHHKVGWSILSTKVIDPEK